MLYKFKYYIFLAACSLQVLGFGKNVYSTFDNPSAEESATIALEQQKPDKAIAILEKALADDISNYQLTSLLASAKAQKAGVDTIDLVLNMVSSAESSSSSNGIVALFTVMPEASEENLILITQAQDHLISIPEASRTDADIFRLSMYYTAMMVLQTKTLDKDGDGNLSLDELLAMDEQKAIAIVTSLEGAGTLLEDYAGDGRNANAAQNVTSILAQVNGTEGSSQKEKLSNYLAN